jgi:CRP/FNR family transcriptional regulator
VTVHQAWNGGNIDCLNCSLRSSALFSGLTEQDFDSMHEPVEQLTILPGEVLYKMGESGRHLFTVRDGLIKLVQYLPDGTQRIVRLVKSTDVLGLEMMTGTKYEHEAIVLRKTKLCRYPVTAVTHLSENNPVLHKNLMKKWQKTLADADVWLTRLSTGAAKKRMANLLLLLIDREGSTECYLFSREDIGSILGITIETASRMISEFKRLGLIRMIRNNHFELDVAGLEAVIAS